MKFNIIILGLIYTFITNTLYAQEQDMNQSDTQTPPPSTLEEIALAKAENRQKIAEAELEEAKAKLELKKLKFSNSSTNGLEGTITVETGAGYYSQILAFDSLNISTADIISDLGTEIHSKNIIIGNNFNVLSQTALWNAIEIQINQAETQLKAVIEDYTEDSKPHKPTFETPESVLITAPLALGAITDIAKFFKKDRSLKSFTTEISNNSMNAALARSMLESEKKPSSIIIESINLSQKGALTKRLQTLLTDQSRAISLKEALRRLILPDLEKLTKLKFDIENKEAELKKEQDEEKKELLQQELNQLKEEIIGPKIQEGKWNSAATRFDKIITMVDELTNSLLEKTTDDRSIIESIAEIDAIKGLDETDTRLLIVELSSKGGETETVKGALLSKGKITYLGGTVITYVLMKVDGTIINSGVIPSYKTEQYKSLKALTKK